MNERFDRHPDTIFRVIKGNPLIMNYKTGDVMALNELGTVVWEKIPATLARMVENIAVEYDVSTDEVYQDVLEFLDCLEKQNFVVIDRKKEGGFSRFPRSVSGEIQLEKIKQLGIQECIPIVAKFELLYHCNLNCIHCANITERWRESTLDTKGVKHIIDQLYDIGTMVISFTGGEIFLRKDLWDIIEYADRKGFLIELLTSATLMTKADVKKLKHYRISNVQISIYSHNPQVHDSVTGLSGSYEKSIKMINCLIENKINTLIVTPLMKVNFQGCQKVKELSGQPGVSVKHSFSYPIFERNDGRKDVYDLRLSKEEIHKFYSENPDAAICKSKDINEAICYAGVNQCSISPFGDISPCFHSLLQMNLGNLREQSLEDIWTNSKELENLRNLKILHLEDCRECPALSTCPLCPGINMRATNNLLEPAQVCCDYAFCAKEMVDRPSIAI